MNNQPAARDNYSQWLPAALIALACGIVYLAMRPPLFDFDGYMYRMYALQPGWFYNANPHHLLWNFIQGLIATAAAAVGHPTSVPFQMVGIAVSCATLFLLFALLRKSSGSTLFAAAGVLLVAFSPEFWFPGFQNRPYSWMFLALVLYLLAWHTKDGRAPSGLRLVVAGFFLVIVILLQQAAVLLVPAAAVVLIACGRGTPRQRLTRGMAWASAMTASVLLLYLATWVETARKNVGFLRWTTSYAYELHAPGLFDFGLPMTLVKSVMGISGAVMQHTRIMSFLSDNFSNNAVIATYGAAGILACLIIGAAAWKGRGRLVGLIRSNALFSISFLSLLVWSTFVFVWQSPEPHFWAPDLFFALVCLGLVMRSLMWRGLLGFGAIALLLAVWNGYYDHQYDLAYSPNFPEPLVASVQKHIGGRDIFIVVAWERWFNGMDYDLLFACMQYTPRNPGLAIFNDFVLPAGRSSSWQDKLRARIDATLASGGRIFVAAHVFEPFSYMDLSGINDPFSPAISKEYIGAEGPAIYQGVRRTLGPYKLKQSDFSIGSDKYFLIER